MSNIIQEKTVVTRSIVSGVYRTKMTETHVAVKYNNSDTVELQFGGSSFPGSQIAGASDLRELADFFTQLADVLEGGDR